MTRRTRHRGPSKWKPSVSIILGLLLVGIVAGLTVPSASFTAATLNRSQSTDVVTDGESVLNLSVASGVKLGTTEQLTEMTNELDSDADITIELRNGTEDDGTLVLNGETVGDSTTFTLNPDESQTVSVEVVCDESLSDNRLYFDIELNASSVTGTVRRNVPIDDNTCGNRLVYVAPASTMLLDSPQLRSVTTESDPRKYEAQGVNVIGPQEVDLDADSLREIPFVNGSSKLYLIDKNNETQVLATSGIRTKKSLLWAGSWNGTNKAVYYANSSNKDIYRVRPGETPTLVSADAKAKAVAGAADIDGDTSQELVYLDGSGNVEYLTGEGGTEKTGRGVGSNNGYGIGAPADFNKDGTARIPIVTGSNNVALITADGTRTKLGGNAEKTTVAPYDWDNDGNLEIVYLEKSDHILKYVDGIADGTGSVTMKTAQDGNSNNVTAATEPGTA